MKKITFLAALLLTVAAAHATSFKVGPASSSDKMDFADINAAMSSSSVNHGDTLWLDKNCNLTSDQTVTKKVVIIGTGYDDTQTTEGTVAKIPSNIYLKTDNIVLKGIYLNCVYFYNSNCTIDRCRIEQAYTATNSAGTNTIISSYITGCVRGYSSSLSDRSCFNLYNNLIVSDWGDVIYYLKNSDIQYNTIIDTYSSSNYMFSYINDSQIKNNILLRTYSSSYYDYIFSKYSNLAIDHNILSWTSADSSYPDNKVGYGAAESSLFVCSGTYSDYYVLADNSAAKGYATDGGEIGCHGGMYGNPAGGRPQYVPYFSNVVVASKSANGKLPISVTAKIQNK